MSLGNPIETVRVGEDGRNKLLTLKKRPGIKNWNILCRWAFCTSLANPSSPAGLNKESIDSDSESGTEKPLTVEMSWSTFGCVHADVYTALLVARCFSDGMPLDKDTLSEQFRLHINRGLGYLVEPDGPKSLEDLVASAVIKKNYS